MQIVIPMVGLGQRFKNAGYQTPKPLLDVGGAPMIVRVIQDLPSATRTVFVINRDHIREFEIDRILKSYFPDCIQVVAEQLTQGQACSVQLAMSELDPEEGVLVAACDNTHVFDETRWNAATTDSETSCLIWTYRDEPRVLVNPHWYGWVDTDETNRVKRISVKKPISETMLRDHVVSGTFWFQSAEIMNRGIQDLIDRNERVNNEFYLDSVPSVMLGQGQKVCVFEVDKYIGWGTPHDYEDYQRWCNYFRRHSHHYAA